MATHVDVRVLRERVEQVVARHDRARDAKDFSRWKDDPVGFIVHELKEDPWEVQIRIAELLRDTPRVVVRSANSCGKGWLASRLALWWCVCRGGLVVMTSATLRQVRLSLMRELRSAFARNPGLPGVLFEESLRMDESREAGIFAFTSDSASKWQGIHHPQLLIIVDEAQGCDPEVFEAAIACVPTRWLVLGNPLRPSGDFYRISQAENWENVHIPVTQHPNIKERRDVIPGGPTLEWVQLMRDEYGETSSIFRARVLAEFPEEAVEGLVKREWIRRAVARWESGEMDDQTISRPPLLALDVARFGMDESVLAHIHGPVVRELVTWRGLSLKQSAEKVEAYGRALAEATFGSKWAGEWAGHTPTCYVDEPGMGGGVIDVLQGRYPVRAFNGANRASDPRRFANKRAESFWAFREALENGKVALPPDKALEEEALAIEWQINAAGQIQILGKDLLRKALGRSPDRLDSVVIGLYHSIGIRSSFRVFEFYI